MLLTILKRWGGDKKGPPEGQTKVPPGIVENGNAPKFWLTSLDVISSRANKPRWLSCGVKVWTRVVGGISGENGYSIETYLQNYCTFGRKMENLVPTPSSDSTEILPLWLLVIMKYETESPSPVPSPTGLVVKNGSKIFLQVSSSMP